MSNNSEDRAKQQDYSISDEIDIFLARELADKLDECNQRISSLVIASQELDPKATNARDFLRRVSRCYIHGFDSECIILCRSVLDAAFDPDAMRDDCIDVLGPRDPPNFPLKDRIAVALSRGRLNEGVAAMAWEVRDIGNKAVPGQPSETMDAFTVIAKTLTVLKKLDATRRKE